MSKQFNRRSIRLKGYDYSNEGLYFVTICCEDRACRFGEVVNGEMILNEAGIMVDRWVHEIPNKFIDIQINEYIIMPNHIHIIIVNNGVGVDLCVNPNNANNPNNAVNPNDVVNTTIEKIDKKTVTLQQNTIVANQSGLNANQSGLNENQSDLNANQSDLNANTFNFHKIQSNNIEHKPEPIEGEHTGSPLHRVVQWFKTMSTNEHIRGVKNLGWPPFNKKIWQRNYYEHIIRHENAYNNIAQYILNNPLNWEKDKFHLK